MGFTKLDEGILMSSIMAEDSDTFKVWIAFLAACGYDGIARVSSVYIASVCHLPEDVVDKAIEHLEAPDPRSRSLVKEGRRIIRMDGGWFVVNYKKYREFTYSDSPEAIRQRRHRDLVRERDGALRVTKPRDISASASASTSASISEEEIDKKFDEFWTAYPREGRLAKKESRIKFGALVKRGELAEFIKGFHGYLDFLKHQKLKNNFAQTPMYAKTFLNGRWSEFVGFKFDPDL